VVKKKPVKKKGERTAVDVSRDFFPQKGLTIRKGRDKKDPMLFRDEASCSRRKKKKKRAGP